MPLPGGFPLDSILPKRAKQSPPAPTSRAPRLDWGRVRCGKARGLGILCRVRKSWCSLPTAARSSRDPSRPEGIVPAHCSGFCP